MKESIELDAKQKKEIVSMIIAESNAMVCEAIQGMRGAITTQIEENHKDLKSHMINYEIQQNKLDAKYNIRFESIENEIYNLKNHYQKLTRMQVFFDRFSQHVTRYGYGYLVLIITFFFVNLFV